MASSSSSVGVGVGISSTTGSSTGAGDFSFFFEVRNVAGNFLIVRFIGGGVAMLWSREERIKASSCGSRASLAFFSRSSFESLCFL